LVKFFRNTKASTTFFQKILNEFKRFSKSVEGKSNPAGEYGKSDSGKFRESLDRIKALTAVQKYLAGSNEAFER